MLTESVPTFEPVQQFNISIQGFPTNCKIRTDSFCSPIQKYSGKNDTEFSHYSEKPWALAAQKRPRANEKLIKLLKLI